MPQIIQKNILIFAIVMLGFGWPVGPSYSAIGMDRVRNAFEKETGGQWSKATSEEKKDFLNDIKGREGFQEKIEYKGKKEKHDRAPRTVEGSTLSEQREDIAPYYIREGFEKATGRVWEEAAKIEQEQYWASYIAKEKNQKIVDAQRLEDRKRRKEQRKRERQLKQDEINRKKDARARQKELRRDERRRKRAETQRKVEAARQRMKQMRNQSRSSR